MVERLNRFPQGAPPSKLLYGILRILVSEKEAGIIARLPIKPFTAEQAAAILKSDLTETRQALDKLASRAMLVDMEQNGRQCYCLPPPMAGFFEFSLMRVRSDIDQQALSELYKQYISVEDDFMKALVCRGQTQLGRIYAGEDALDSFESREHMQVLDWERAGHIADEASCIGVSQCYCRFKARRTGGGCDAPMDICMTFNTTAKTLVKYGHARQIDAAECRDLFQAAYDNNLVQFGENTREGVNFICNCCKCCCEALGRSAASAFRARSTPII